MGMKVDVGWRSASLGRPVVRKQHEGDIKVTQNVMFMGNYYI